MQVPDSITMKPIFAGRKPGGYLTIYRNEFYRVTKVEVRENPVLGLDTIYSLDGDDNPYFTWEGCRAALRARVPQHDKWIVLCSTCGTRVRRHLAIWQRLRNLVIGLKRGNPQRRTVFCEACPPCG